MTAVPATCPNCLPYNRREVIEICVLSSSRIVQFQGQDRLSAVASSVPSFLVQMSAAL